MTKMNKIESLWPSLDEIGTAPFVAPVTILREQAEAIRTLTQNIIEGQVIQETLLKSVPEPKKAGDKVTTPGYKDFGLPKNLIDGETREIIEIQDQVKFSLFLRMPTFNGSRKKIISIEHDIVQIYPTKIDSISSDHRNIEAKDEEEFKKILHEILHADEMLAILQSFLAQSGYQQAA